MNKAIFIALFVALALSWSANASAHVLADVYALLEVEEPTLLPDSSFYFLKSIGRWFKLFFTFDSVKKAELEFKFMDEKLAETYKLFDTTDEQAALELAFQNYLRAHDRLQARLESIGGSNKNVDTLLEKLAARVIDHQELLDELEEKLPEENLLMAKRGFAENLQKAFELNKDKLKERLTGKIRQARENTLKNLRRLEELGELEGELKEELKDLEEGLPDIFDDARERAKDAIADAKKEISEAEEKLRTAADEEINKSVGALLANAKKNLTEAEAAFAEERYGMAFGLANAAEMTAESAKKILERAGDLKEEAEDLKKALDELEDLEFPELSDENIPTKAEDQVICIQLWDPVCGVDGKTYSNDCFARLAKVAVKHKGECAVASEETQVKPAPPPPPSPLPSLPTMEPASFTVEADDSGFYPGTALVVDKNAKVKITFKVRSTGVYFGGLDFRSSKFKTAAIPPGGSTTVEFSADESFTVTSYWPASGVKKADLKIEVK